MKTIRSITLKNFKFVKDEAIFNFHGRNAIIYGQNGSGKSTIFWALYTFFESGFKNEKDVQKYFDKDKDENLLNRFMDDDDDSYIMVSFIDKDETITEKKISYDNINTHCDLVKEARMSSDFINHRFLSRMYDFRNSEEIDIFPALSMDILDYAHEDGHNLGELWNEIKDGLGYNGKSKYNMKSDEYRAYVKKVARFNEAFSRFLQKLAHEANIIIKEGFKEDIVLNINRRKAEWNYHLPGESKRRSYKLRYPVVNITLTYLPDEQGSSELKRPHTYLNEGRLNITFLALRLALFRLKPKSKQFQLLVLDDLLLSLDMNYRMNVLDLLFKDFDDYQMIILTHDLGFFNLLKTYYDKPDWIYYSLLPDRDFLQFEEDKTYIQQAEHFMQTGEYEICAQLLRKELERRIKQHFGQGITTFDEPLTGLKTQLSKIQATARDQNYIEFNRLIYNKKLSSDNILELKKIQLKSEQIDDKTKEKLMQFNSKLISLISKFKAENRSVTQIINNVKNVIDRLHQGAHDNINFPQFKRELEDAIDAIRELDDFVLKPYARPIVDKVKKISNCKKEQEVLPAVAGMIENELDDMLVLDKGIFEIQENIIDFAKNMNNESLERALSFLFHNYLTDHKNINNNNFVGSIIDLCKTKPDKMRVIGEYAADLLNEGIELNTRVKRSLDSSCGILWYDDTMGIKKWVFSRKDPAPF